MLNCTMVSSGAEMSSPAPPHHSHDVNVIYSPVPHSNASTPPNIMSCEYHPAYGPIPIGADCAYYGAQTPGPHDSYQYIGTTDNCGSYPQLNHQLCALSEYGPMTVPLVSTNSNPPIPLPMQVPPGHVVQQIVDESGTLRHVIVSPQPPLMSIPAYGPGSNSQPFYGHGGYPNPFANPMGGGLPCGMHHPNQGGPTPPPLGTGGVGAGGNYGAHGPPHNKDDRNNPNNPNNKPFPKPRRKFEPKSSREPNSSSSAASYPNHYHQSNGAYLRKDGPYNNNNNNNNNNNTRRNIPNGTSKGTNGAAQMVEEDGSIGSTGSVTSTGTQDEEEESRLTAQTEMLSAIVPPIVSDVTCRSAFIKWNHPERFNEAGENKYPEIDASDSEFRYEVFICDRSRADARFKSIFCGTALSCRVKDLKPGTPYAISYCAMLNDVKGSTSETSFTTAPSEPDVPQSPRAITRNRNALTFKWNAPNDNGSKITSYLLEFDEGKGGSHFVEAYRGKNKQCTVSKLQPAYSYQFRLAAINDLGQSRFSPTTTVMTAGSPPAQPVPPTLTEAGVTYLTLEWKSRPTDDEYSLQMEDPASGHGFLGAYSGNAPHCTCIGLKRYSDYKFRVKSYNSEGHSRWSDEVSFRTLPDRPGPPHKPALKGRVHATSFKVRWEPPNDDGGIPVALYALQIEQGNGGFEEIYRGPETEYNVDNLSPGQSYPLRVIAVGPGGLSDPSEPCVITTEPVCPGKCHIPRTVGKPKSNSVHLKWSSPDWDGGSPVNQYEVGCTTPDNQTQEAYRGKDTSCFVNGLLPGRSYLFQVRAFNRIGPGAWSDPLEIISGPGVPDPPLQPKVSNKSSHSLLITWTEPLNNGSAITEYRLQMASPQPQTQPELPPSSVDEDSEPTPPQDIVEEEPSQETSEVHKPQEPEEPPAATFSQVYSGPRPSCELKSLCPASIYLFRVQAANSVGSSDWSSVSTHQMPASSPNQVSHVEGSADSSSISLSWSVPASNGSPILHYNLMLGETVILSTSSSYVLTNLMPDTHHKIRIQAVNSVGPGPFSPAFKISTKPLPPQPPKLELVSATHFWIKLKWNSSESGPATSSSKNSNNIEYIVQMMNPYQDEFQVVYRGTTTNCKVARLTEETEYQFRISGLNAAGQGPFSDMFRFNTLRAPPPPVKGLKYTSLKESETHRFEWSEVSTPDVIYQLQIAKKKNQEFTTFYRGEMKKYEMNLDVLDSGVEYIARVCGIRKSEDGNELLGPYSNLLNFTCPLPTPTLTSKSITSSASSSFKSNLSTTALVLEQKVNSISYESRVGIMAVVALVVLAIVISFITHHVVT